MKQRFAILLMFLGWLAYGAMPAGACPMYGLQMSATMHSQAAPHVMPAMAMDHPGMASHDHGHPDEGTPCASLHMSFCPNCLVVPPAMTADSNVSPTFSYPQPSRARPLDGDVPAPTPRPPRFA